MGRADDPDEFDPDRDTLQPFGVMSGKPWHRLTFTFDDAELERSFLADSYVSSIGILRYGLLLAGTLYAAFGVLDIYMLPVSHRTTWLIRFAIVLPAIVLVLISTFSARFERVNVPVVLLAGSILGAGILAMTWFARGDIPMPASGVCPTGLVPRDGACMERGYHSYYTGLLLVVIWVGTFSQLRFWHAALCVLGILAGYLIVTIGRHGMTTGGFTSTDFPVFVNNSFFLLGAAILSVFSAYAFERSKRNGYLQTQAIAREKAKTQTLLRRIEVLFGQQVSEEVAKELVGRSDRIESRLCQVTVMFLDIRDFTAFADSREPREVASFQNAVFSELIDIIRAHRGIINQILGDGIMATFGAPVEVPTHVTDAVAAGHRILERIDEIARDGRIPPIRVGIALHCGQVLAGNIGNEFRKQYSLTGGTVNIASRLEGLNKEFGSRFLISAAVREHLAEDAAVESLGEVRLRGVARPVPVFRLD